MLSLVQEVFAKATRLEIDTSGGIQVWHVWNPSAHKNPEARRPLVLLHGGSGSWTHWIRNVEVLSADRAVWAIDLPGFGDSDLPPEVRDVDLMFPYVVEGIRQLFGGDPINLMGFSFGGMTAGFIAAHHPELVHELMLIGIPALGMFGQSRPLRGMREDMTAQERDAVLHHNLLQLMLHKPESIDDETLRIQDRNVLRDRMKRRRIARGDILLELQKRWVCPVHSLWGEFDVLYPGRLEEVKQALGGCCLESFHIIPDAGHWVMYERAEEFNRLALQCLQHADALDDALRLRSVPPPRLLQ